MAILKPAVLALCLSLVAGPLAAQSGHDGGGQTAEVTQSDRWITLGTRGGPLASATRAQPANLLVHQGHNYLIDAGDGVTGQLARAGVATADVRAVFLSHLHFDHTAGLAALLGLRWQTNAAEPLVVYGPPETRALIDGIIASMIPGTTAGYGVPGAPSQDPADTVRVIEMRNGDVVQIDGMTVRAVHNSHYSFTPGSDEESRFQSLSFRFDLPGRSIVYTGDTGPSDAVTRLAAGADLLVAEMMDVEWTIATVRRNSPNMPAPALAAMESHLRDHHLLPQDVGQMARQAGVGALVVTHFVGREPDERGHLAYLATISEHFAGPAVIANDMDGF